MTTMDVLDVRKLPADRREASVLEHLRGLSKGDSVGLIADHDPRPLLRKVLDEFPLGFDFAPLEQGPEWRYRITARDRDVHRTVTDHLAWDHDRLDGLLSSALEHAERSDWSAAAALLRDFRHGLERHIAIEEGILFPEFEQRTGMRGGGPTAVMRFEHTEIKRWLEESSRAFDAKDLEDAKRCQAGLIGVLAGHNLKEEHILYPGTDRLFDAAALDALVARLLLG